ncbi:MAG: nitroreductase family protein [bacterium]
MDGAATRPYSEYTEYAPDEMHARAAAFAQDIARRRSVRSFSTAPVPRDIIEHCIAAAASAPSGANRQPWHFVAVANTQVKAAIRRAAEAEEQRFYEERAPKEWLDALAPLQTDARKPFLDDAAWLIAVFAQRVLPLADGTQAKNYYVPESVGIATGFLLAALHNAGLATLTHTPSPMTFLRDLLGRPKSERAYMLVVAGYPQDNVAVPDIKRKSLQDVAEFWV